jgi:hypothetical protein
MAETKEQNFKNHPRYDPIYHFVLLPILLVTVIGAATHAVRYPGKWNIWSVVAWLAVAILAVRLRQFTLMVQDRVIRMEERQRLAMISPAGVAARIGELTIPQLIALRFASDAEAPGLAERALNEKLEPKQIKMAIKVWRADSYRA